MIHADLHVHCNASKRPSEWFLQKVGAQESYTDIDTVYTTAKHNRMDLVTITDHNTIDGCLELVEKYPEDTFISVEVTTYFPENSCKIHILLFDITEDEFKTIDRLRHDIYQLRDYIRDNDIAYSVAHGFYSVNKRLDLETLEKLILLFDIFEGRNGARNKDYNEAWQTILQSLTPVHLQQLKARYDIEPISADPWIKGFTGGSDDHAGLFIGLTATVSHEQTSNKAGFIRDIKTKKTACTGRCNDYKSFAFSIYKIFCDYSNGAHKNTPGGILAFINTVVFDDRQNRLKQWLTMRKVKKGKQTKDKIILKFFEDVSHWSHNQQLDMETKMERIYHSMGLLLDEFSRLLIRSFVNDFSKGDIGKLFRNLMSAFPALFISVPFFSALRHLSQDRETILELTEKYVGRKNPVGKKILWFTDTFSDLNGVSVTLGKFRTQSEKRDLNITFVTCLPEPEKTGQKNEHLLYLPCIESLTPDFYTAYTLNFPSLLASMEMIYHYRPDRIIISTPGPVGLLGMTMAGMLGIECTSIYHTDFAAQAKYIFRDETIAGIIQSAINRFYSFSTHIKVPTKEYISILEQQNYDVTKMSVFKRGITVPVLNVNPSWKDEFRKLLNLEKGFTLLWAGRVSKDKNIEFLLDLFDKTSQTIPDLNLVLCGSGPDLEYYQKKCRHLNRIHFAGFVENHHLRRYYEFADLFVFPSTTDTFGMVVLEAQSCGLPAMVTDIGGPQEIVNDRKTGFVLSLSSISAWIQRIEEIHTLKMNNPNEFAMMRARCQHHVSENFNWDEALYDILGECASIREMKPRKHPGRSMKNQLQECADSSDVPIISRKVVA